MIRQTGDRGAFSLLEILITAAVLSIAMVPLLLSISLSTRTVGGTRDHLSAVAFAQRTLEDLRRASYRASDRPSGTAPRGEGSPLVPLDEMVERMNAAGEMDARTCRGSRLVENGVAFTRSIQLFPDLKNIEMNGLPDVRVCAVTVTWRPLSSGVFQREQTYQLFTAFGSAER